MSYAIIRTGGKQYRVKQGDRLRVEKLVAEVGQEVELGDVLARGEGSELKFGADAAGPVKIKVVGHGRGPKIRIWKSKKRKGYEKRQGHRQDFTEILVVSI